MEYKLSNHKYYSIPQEMVQAKDPPSHYLTKLRTYLDPTASKSHRVSRQKQVDVENSHDAK